MEVLSRDSGGESNTVLRGYSQPGGDSLQRGPFKPRQTIGISKADMVLGSTSSA